MTGNVAGTWLPWFGLVAALACTQNAPAARESASGSTARFVRVDSTTVLENTNGDTMVIQPGMVFRRGQPRELSDPYRGRYLVLIRDNHWWLDQRHASLVNSFNSPGQAVAARVRDDASAVLAWAADERYCEAAAAGGRGRDDINEIAVLNARQDRYMHRLFAHFGVSLAWYYTLVNVSSNSLPAGTTIPPRPRTASDCPQYAGGDGWWVAHFAYLPKPGM